MGVLSHVGKRVCSFFPRPAGPGIMTFSMAYASWGSSGALLGSPLPLTKSAKEGPALSLSLNVVVFRLLGAASGSRGVVGDGVELVVA